MPAHNLFSRVLQYLAYLVVVSYLTKAASVVINGKNCIVDQIISRDICIVGGGSTGTYSAIRLSDLGRSIIVVDKENRLGGHTQTYTDPGTGKKVDYGVDVWHNLTIVHNYFARLDVSLVKADFSTTGVARYLDFRTGETDVAYTRRDPTAALAGYAAQLAKYPYLENGFDLPQSVPEDLLLPFEEFVKKYSLQDLVEFLFNFSQGLGNLLAQSTLYVFKNFGMGVMHDLGAGFLTTALHDNSLLYEQAAAHLGKEKLVLNSTIVAVDRGDPEEAKILVQTPSDLILIKSRKLVFTIPPKLHNLRGWDLSESERTLFGLFQNSGYYTGLLRNTGLPANLSAVNIGTGTRYNQLVLPGIYSVDPTIVPGLFRVGLGSAESIADEEVKEAILKAVKRLEIPGKGPSHPEFAVYASHAPFELTVPSRAIAKGFYRDLYALQGQRHTYYTGAAFHTQDSSLLWQFTEALLPAIMAS